jgi:hypothetical protein
MARFEKNIDSPEDLVYYHEVMDQSPTSMGRNFAMPELVTVSNVEKTEKLKDYIEELFKKGRYSDITLAIGLHSIFIESEHMIADQKDLYHFVLHLVKDLIKKSKGSSYSAWYADFPTQMEQLLSSGQVVADKAAEDVLASHRSAVGPFKTVDDFFFWALEDRHLKLEQIVLYIQRTAGTGLC